MENATISGIKELTWRQPKSMARYYELDDGTSVLQSLEFPSGWNTLAVAQSDERWTFKRVGFCNPQITVRRAGQPENLAVYRPRVWGDGVLTLADGRTYKWKSLNFWSSRWAFFDAQGQPVLTLSDRVPGRTWRDIFKSQYTLEVHQAAPAFLPALGMYLLILQQEDGSAVAASVSATA